MSAQADKSEQQIAATIRSVAGFKRRRNAQRQWLRTGACFVVGLLIVVVVDWYAAWQSPLPRWSGPLLVLGVSAFFLYRTLQIQLARPDIPAAARSLDRSSSRSQERWSTIAALQPDGAGATGSSAMAKALVGETAPMCRFVDPAKIDPQTVDRRSLLILSVSSFLLLAFLAAFLLQGSPRLLARFAFPWADLPLTRINELTPPHSPLLTGSDAEIRASVGGKIPTNVVLEMADGRSDLESTSATRRLTSETLTEKGKPNVFTVERLRKPIRYRLLAGDAATPWRTVNLTDRPQLTFIEVSVSDPDYSTRPPRVWQKAPSQVQAVRGSSIEIILEMDRDISKSELEAAIGDGDTQALPMQKIEERRYRFFTELNADLMFRPTFESTEGHANRSLPFCQIEVVADQAPSVELSADSAREIVSLSHDIDVAFDAHDDIGIMAAELVLTITDAEGHQREEVLPIELGEQKGKGAIEIRQAIPTSELGLKPDDALSYAVRVRDTYEQIADAGEDESRSHDSNATAQKGGLDDANDTRNQMTKRSLKTGGQNGAQSTSEKRPLRIANRKIINEIDAKKKKILAVEAAFGQLKAHISSALKHTRNAKAPKFVRGEKRDMRPLYASVESARKDIDTASLATRNFATEAPGTPYAFLSLQLQTVVRSHLDPAEAKLKGSVAGSLDELPPREPHRNMAEGHLAQAIAALKRLDSSVAHVRSQVEAETAMSDLMEMHVAQVEDLPVLMEPGGSGTPYQRSPAEVSKEQAEAALKFLESRKGLYQKTAELLEQNPALWQRYMDKSQKESEIFRDQLEALSHRHQRVQTMTLGRRAKDDSAVTRELEAAIVVHHEKVATALQRTLAKARTWSPEDDPAWLKPLNSGLLNAMRSSGAEANDVDAMIRSSEQTVNDLNEATSQLRDSIRKADGGNQRFFALRLGELESTLSEQRLLHELNKALKSQNWQRATLLEQTNIAHQTQELLGKIEVESAGLLSLSEAVARAGEAFTEMAQNELMPPLGESVEQLQSGDSSAVFHAVAAQEKATEGYHAVVRALDNFVMAAIKEKDQRSKGKANAGVAGLPKITANTLQELQEKLDAEQEATESFGIPCCRPTNFQVISDWETFAKPSQGSTPRRDSAGSSSKPSPPSSELASNSPRKKSEDAGKAKDREAPESNTGEAPPGKAPPAEQGEPGGQRSQVDVASLTESSADGEDRANAPPKTNPSSTEPNGTGGPSGTPSSTGQTAASSAENTDSGKPQGRSIEMAQLARDQSLQQARSIAQSLAQTSAANTTANPQRSANSAKIDAEATALTKATTTIGGRNAQLEVDGHGVDEDGLSARGTFFRDAGTEGRDWNRIGSELRREFLQEENTQLPEHYRDAVEEYFRQLSKWQGRSPSTQTK